MGAASVDSSAYSGRVHPWFYYGKAMGTAVIGAAHLFAVPGMHPSLCTLVCKSSSVAEIRKYANDTGEGSGYTGMGVSTA